LDAGFNPFNVEELRKPESPVVAGIFAFRRLNSEEIRELT
jgi:hypothetical protein